MCVCVREREGEGCREKGEKNEECGIHNAYCIMGIPSCKGRLRVKWKMNKFPTEADSFT